MTYPILAIDTTGQFASVSLRIEKGDEIHTESLNEKLNHLKGLLPLMDKLLTGFGLNIKDIKTIAVSQGPGSFTGIRIGISTVRAIAQITGAKVIGVPTLETFVYNDPFYRGIVCPVFDARMKQIYSGAFILNENKINILIKTDSYVPMDYYALLSKLVDDNAQTFENSLDFKFFGDGVDVFKDEIKHWGGKMRKDFFSDFSLSFEKNNKLQLASSVLQWAENFGQEKDYFSLLPIYVRKAEAQRKLDEKNACG